MLLLLVAFLGGVLTVLSPCVLPVLPVLPVLMSGAVGGHGRPLGIIAGFIGSFVLLTLFLASLVNALGLQAEVLRWAAVALLMGFGLILAIPAWHERFEFYMARTLPPSQGHRQGQDRSGFLGGLLIGTTLGLVWSPCVGPILASVTTLALSGQITVFAAVITFAYALGVALPMLMVMWGGRKLLHRPTLLSRLSTIQQAFGVVLMLFATAMLLGLDKAAQTFLVDHIPALEQLTFLEDSQAVQDQLQRTLQ